MRAEPVRRHPSAATIFSRGVFLGAIGLAILAGASISRGQSATLTAPTTNYSPAGGSVTLTATLNYAAPIAPPTALGFTIVIPPGWTVASVGGPNPVGVGPNPGETGQLGFAYFSFPANSAQFTVTVNYAAGLTGNQTITASGEYRSPTQNLPIPAIVIAPAQSQSAPTITAQPVNQGVVVGGAATFTVTATGSGTLTYQWRKNGAPISGATSTTFLIGSAQTVDAGSYDVVVTNGAGNVTSTAATLTVTTSPVAPVISVQPVSRSVAPGTAVSFSVTASGMPTPSYQWRKNGVAIGGATSTTYSIAAVQAGDAGGYDVVVTNSAGNVTSSAATLTIITDGTSQPVISVQPLSQTLAAGAAASFTVTASGTPTPTYQWRKNGVAIAGATSATLALVSVQAGDAGSYDVVVSNSAGNVTSNAATLTLLASRLINASVRCAAGAGEQTLVVGFVIGGTGSKRVLVRGVGPSLTQFGVPNALADPQLRLFTDKGALIVSNDDWTGDTALAAAFSQVGAFPLATNSKDAAVLPLLPAGSYAAHVTSAGGSGVALLETYDADASSSTARFINLSVLAGVGTGGNVLVIGFVIGGNASKNLLIRGAGPALAQFGVGNILIDPQLRLFDDKNRVIQQNNDWGDDAALVSAATQAGAFAFGAGSKDAALRVTLPPGLYSAEVSGGGETTGTALVELYELP